jgi:hypothetical protein
MLGAVIVIDVAFWTAVTTFARNEETVRQGGVAVAQPAEFDDIDWPLASA